MSSNPDSALLDAVRRFSTFFERRLGPLDQEMSHRLQPLLNGLDESARVRLREAMQAIQSILGDDPEAQGTRPFVIRTHRSGDMGWITWRHGVLYSREYGWTERFEALVAQIAADFLHSFNAERDRCWIAERGGVPVGSVMLVSHPSHQGVARLRLLLVEPQARGSGIGRYLVHECTRFARSAGYHTITLWTNELLHSARRLYENEGYMLVEDQVPDGYGLDLLGQTWELSLVDPDPPEVL